MVAAWGDNTYGQCDVPAGLTNVVAIAAGTDECAALTADGMVYVWGAGFSQSDVPGGLGFVVAVATQASHFITLNSDGIVASFGTNNYAGEGNPNRNFENNIAIAQTEGDSVFIKNNRTVYVQGSNAFGQTDMPTNLGNVTDIACGYDHILSLSLPLVAQDDTYTTTANTTLTVSEANGVLGSDSGALGATAVLVTSTEHGNVSLATDGSFVYVPNKGYAGDDTFTYYDSLGALQSNVATVTIHVSEFRSLTVSPGSVTGGTSSVGTITLTAPAPSNGVRILLSSGDPSVTVPASIKIAAGSSVGTFTIKTQGVSADMTVPISASYSNASVSSDLTVKAPGFSLTVSSNEVPGGSSVRGTVTLSGPAPAGGMVVSLTSSTPSASVPGSITIPAGSRVGKFTATTEGVDSNTTVILEAASGGSTANATVVVDAAVIGACTSPATVEGGKSATVIVNLIGKAGPSGLVVSLVSDNPAVIVPESFTIAPQIAKGSVKVKSAKVATPTAATITISANGTSQTVTLTVQPR